MHYIVISCILFVVGLVLIFYLRPKWNNRVTEMKFMQTKKVSEVLDMFAQMRASGLEDSYREYVELKGSAVSDQLVNAPFSNQPVVYCDSTLSQVTERRERYQDSEGNWKERTVRNETNISSEKSSQYIRLKDSSSDVPVTLEITASGCSFDIPKTFDRFEPRNSLTQYNFFQSFSFDHYGTDTLGFRMTEKTIQPNQQLYVLGELYKSGDEIHLGTPSDRKKPFVITTKSEEDMVNSTGRNSLIALVGGIASVVVGVVLLFL